PNPSGLSAEVLDSQIELTWDAVLPAEYVKQYAIYVQDAAFSSVAGLTPRVWVSAGTPQARVAGLVNGQAYHFAVTTRNLSDGETPTVVSLEATPSYDTVGPVITAVTLNGTPLVAGATVTQSGTLVVTASDLSGIGRVEFRLDGAAFASDINPADGLSAAWDLDGVSDGAHTLTLAAYDTLGNETLQELSLTVALAPPPVPSISTPISGVETNTPSLEVHGTAAPQSEVWLSIESVQVAGPLSVDSAGQFSGTVTLNEGSNSLTAAASNRGGSSAPSGAVTVTLDTSRPDAPSGLTAESRGEGQITLGWTVSSDPRVVSYDLYRSLTPFTALEQATRANSQPLTEGRFTDLPAVDGNYVYRVVARNELQTASALSVPVAAVADSQRPQAVAITYTPSGSYDPATGRMATGPVDVALEVSEPLLTTPFLSIASSGGVPMAVALEAVDGTHYQGRFEISDTTPSGTAYAVFSARDVVGNRGDEILSGASLLIDTAGPAVTRLTVSPGSPIRTDQTEPTQVMVEIELDQPVKSGSSPALGYLLSGAGRVETAIEGLVPITATIWRGSFVLPGDAGLVEVENLQFRLQARDDLDNLGSRILAPNLFQVYQGALPPLAIPLELTAEALAGGQVALGWKPVTDAGGYQLYRQAPGEASLSAYQRVSGTAYQDTTSLDGEYRYAIASVREANGQEALSGQSPAVSVTTDASVPGVPRNLSLELVGAGIKALWEAPAGLGEDVTYSLYRSSGTVLSDVSGLTPVQTRIVANSAGQLGFIDTQANENEAVYAVTAVDTAGNASAPSASAYLNVDLLPVASLTVRQEDQGLPEIQWSHNGGNIAGYKLYVEAETSPLNLGLIAGTSYSDNSYTGGERRYRVVAQDTVGVDSIERGVMLPEVTVTLAEASQLNRGVMNRLDYQVANTGSRALSGVRLQVVLEGVPYNSASFDLAPGAQQPVAVIVGGAQALPDLTSLQQRVQVLAETGEQAEVIRNQAISIGDDTLLLQVESRSLTRGTAGEVRFVLENTSAVETEILLSRAGNQATDEARIILQDADGNVLSVTPLQQATGEGVITLIDGRAVARIAPGGRFTSGWYGVAVPESAPVTVEVILEIDRFHYHLGGSDAVAIEGMRSRVPASLADTEYSATIDAITPASSFGDQPILISGQAIDRSSGQPSAGVPVKLVIAGNGFERSAEVFADGNGGYQYSHTPLAGESGIFTVSALHPDMLSRPGQGQFTLQRVSVSPTLLNYTLPRNYQQTLSVVQATTGAGTRAGNLRLVYDAADQAGGQYPVGLTVTLGDPLTLEAQQSAVLPITLSGDNSAMDESLVFRVVSDENPALATITLNLHLAEAKPALRFTPNFVETGVAREGSVTEAITFSNVGLADLTDMQISLHDQDGSPAPSWVQLLSAESQGDLPVGESREIRLAASPGAGVAEGIYPLRLLVESGNSAPVPVNLYVAVTQSGVGSVLFKASDIYTATLDEANNPIPGLANARIRVQNEVVLSVEQTLTTDAYGEALFSDLPAGSYRFRASANNHQDLVGRLSIKPGITGVQEVFLDYNLVTVEWSVREITLEDKYEVTLQAIFETDVPAAVVVLEPASVTLPSMAPGDLFYGELRLTNHGLIRADDLQFTLPGSDAYFRYEFLDTFPTSLEAKESRVIPYRITALAPLDPDGSGSGAGCNSYQQILSGNYGYVCANGTTSRGSCGTQFLVRMDSSSCSVGGGGGSSPTPWTGGGWVGGGTGVSGGVDYSPIKGAQCIPTSGCQKCAECSDKPAGNGPGGK
ncbi:Ig-like domain-containing protein, partial [Sedimenticola hydrogenitrophicus]|uniref:Ig-like domain-containing protein n=1 Tax=Sedimenticola hydrogenitrophicus TaxID=2967975 RepID=UPI0023B04F20